MHRNTLIYLGSYSLSLFGNGIASVLFPLLVLAQTGDVLAAGTVVAVSAAVSAVAGIFAGVVVDRVNRRTVSIVSDVLSAASVAALPVVDAIWGLNLQWFIILAVIGAFGDAPGMTAREVLLPRLVQLQGNNKGDLDRLVGIREALAGTLMLLGPGAGGLLVWLVGVTPEAMYITAATSFLAALLSFGISSEAGQVAVRTAAERGGVRVVLADLWTAWTFLLQHRLLLGTTLLSAMFVAVIVALQATIMPAYFIAEGMPALSGLAASGIALGGLVGAALYAMTVGRVSRRAWFVTGMIGAGAGFAIVGAMLSPWSVLAACIFIGLTNGPMSAVLGVATIEATPDEMRGRVLGAQNALVLAAPALTAAPFGAIASGYGLPAAGIAIAVLIIVTVAIALIAPAFRSLDHVGHAAE
ncbi:MFS transporter [Paracoccus caeni]|uniref:Multidrug efflux pump Tap n=1 Tax=Paracoccus caeni TaxID=657651 RepID=A0A934VVD1_9RHOB|nr:MFS transporter [Paracoccus caeni]MBK4216811.1 MFS transporter [Paracoccus caeni]